MDLDFVGAKDDGGGGGGDTGAIRHAKLQSHHDHQQINTQFFYRPDALPVAHCVRALTAVGSGGLCRGSDTQLFMWRGY